MKIRFFAHLCVAALLSIAFATAASAQSEADLAVIKTGPDLAAPGSNVSYDVTISNGGPNDAAFVTLTDTVPAGMTFVSATQNSGPTFTCDSSVSCTITTFAAGATANFTFVFAIPADAKPGTNFLNVATASSETFDPNPENDTGIAGTNTPPPPSADLGLTKSGPASAAPDTDVTFTLTLTNAGPDTATNVTLTDNVPAPMTFVSFIQTSGPAFTCGTSTCTAASFPAGATAVFELTGHVPNGTPAGTAIDNSANVTSDSDPNGENNTASATVTIQTADVAIAKSGPANATAGTNVTYTITVNNAGPNTAVDLSFSDSLPAGTTFVSLDLISGTAGSCTTPAVGASGTVACSWPLFANGATAQYSLVVAVGNTTSMTNTATAVTASSFDPNANNNTSSVTTTVTPVADLVVTKTAPPSVTASGNVTWTIALANNGPSDATSVVLTDTLPAGTTFVSINQTSGTTFNCSGTATVTCTIASFPAAATASFDLTASIAATASGTLSNTATIASNTTDPDPTNNSATASSTVNIAPADVGIAKTANTAQISVGGTFVYTLVVTNQGPGSASNIVVTDPLPPNTELAGAPTTTQGTCSGTTTVTCNVGTLASGSTATIQITLRALALGTIVNTATVTSAEADPNPANGSSTASLAAVPPPAAIPTLGPWALAFLAFALATVMLLRSR